MNSTHVLCKNMSIGDTSLNPLLQKSRWQLQTLIYAKGVVQQLCFVTGSQTTDSWEVMGSKNKKSVEKLMSHSFEE